MQSCGTGRRPSIWKVNPRHPEKDAINCAASFIRKGGVIVFPTETFYGLGGHPESEGAIERVYQIKGRDFDKPLPLIAAGVSDARRAVSEWPPVAQRLVKAFWPGPLTLVLPVVSHLPPMLHAHTGKIAVRVSPHPVAQALAVAVGGLLISTSANVAGYPSHENPDEIASSFLTRVDGFLHAGILPGHMPSTIVDIGVSPPRLVRAGCLSWEDIERVIRETPRET